MLENSDILGMQRMLGELMAKAEQQAEDRRQAADDRKNIIAILLTQTNMLNTMTDMRTRVERLETTADDFKAWKNRGLGAIWAMSGFAGLVGAILGAAVEYFRK